jgi:plastocyanin
MEMREQLAVLIIALTISLSILAGSPFFHVVIPKAHAVSSSFTLFGKAGVGWGLTSTTIGTPGPTLTVVKGATVTITLTSADGFTHNFGVDYNGDGSCEAATEPCSPNFSTTITFTFVATQTTTTFTYWCFIHKGAMVGSFVVKTNYALFGNAGLGWGSTSGTIMTPGPTLVAAPGTVVTMNLTSSDGLTHNWGIDYNGDGSCEAATEPCSANFSTKTTFTFTTATIPGNYTYYCFIHFAPMIGTFVVRVPHQVGLSSTQGITTSRPDAYNGVTNVNQVRVNVTAENLGANAETFTVNAYANTSTIGTKTIFLTSGNTQVVSFQWNSTTNLAIGHYTLTANATHVTGQTDFSDNQITGGQFNIKLRGDVSGDCKVNIFDLTAVGGSFGATTGQAGFSQEADLNNDGKINIFDLSLVGGNFGATC